MSERTTPLKILGGPTLSPWSVVRLLKRGRRAAPLDSARVVFYFQARYALWHAAKVLGLGRETSVLVPAFQCGTELDAFVELGIPLRFYEVGRSLRVDVEALERAVDDRTRAILVTHYFGHAQDLRPVQRFCRERGLFLIEDCAHTLSGKVGDRFLGTFGDVSVFSMRKILPAPDGGALRINRPDLPLPAARGGPPLSLTLGALKLSITRNLKNRKGRFGRALRAALRSPLVRLLKKGRSHVPEVEETIPDLCAFHPERIHWGMSAVSRRIVESVDPEEVGRRRRENFNYLLANLGVSKEVEALTGPLPPGACPWMLPILARDPDRLLELLRGHGIEIGRFWQDCHPAFPVDAFPEAAFLKRNVLALSVHQDHDRDALDRILAALGTAGRAAATREPAQGTP